MHELLDRAETERVEVAGGGVGRTGAARACLVVLDGIPNAVTHVRANYAKHAVETS